MSKIKEIVDTVKKSVKLDEDNDAYEQHFMMLNNSDLIPISNYAEMVVNKKVNSGDAYAYIVYDFVKDRFSRFKAFYFYPFLWNVAEVYYAYLSKLGKYYYVEDYNLNNNLHIKYYSAPAPSLKYVVSYFEVSESNKYSTIEIIDLDVAAYNMNIDFWLSYVNNDSERIRSVFFDVVLQKLFNHYNAGDASDKLRCYFQGDKSLEKEVTNIIDDYKKIFRPVKVCMKNHNHIDCSDVVKI